MIAFYRLTCRKGGGDICPRCGGCHRCLWRERWGRW